MSTERRPSRIPGSTVERVPDGTLYFDDRRMILEVWRIGRRYAGHRRYAYRFRDLWWNQTEPVFEADDFFIQPPAPPPHADEFFVEGSISPWRAALEIGRYLSMEEGDVDPEYFARYSIRQLRWRDRRAPVLKEEVARRLQDYDFQLVGESWWTGEPPPRRRRRGERKQTWNPRRTPE